MFYVDEHGETVPFDDDSDDDDDSDGAAADKAARAAAARHFLPWAARGGPAHDHALAALLADGTLATREVRRCALRVGGRGRGVF